jgi:hypothetical protein
MDCPFCHRRMRDLFGLSLHLEDEHPKDQGRVGVVVLDRDVLPMVECDIDAIYTKRPDLFAAGG